MINRLEEILNSTSNSNNKNESVNALNWKQSFDTIILQFWDHSLLLSHHENLHGLIPAQQLQSEEETVLVSNSTLVIILRLRPILHYNRHDTEMKKTPTQPNQPNPPKNPNNQRNSFIWLSTGIIVRLVKIFALGVIKLEKWV